MKLVVFDVDGTLLHTHGAGRRALDKAIEEVLGISKPLANFSFAGLTDPIILERLLANLGQPLDGQARLIGAIFARYVEHLHATLTESQQFEVLPGIRELLRRLQARADTGLALGTGNIEEGARLKLKRAGLEGFFPVGGYGSDSRNRTDILQIAVQRAESHYQARTTSLWVVGDTSYDIRAGRSIDAKVLAVATGYLSKVELAIDGPDVLLDDLSDTSAVLAALGC